MATRQTASSRARSELAAALTSCRGALLGILAFSAVINILTLTGSLFMMEVYDRVLPSRSVPTLVGLALIAGALYAFQGVLDVIRARIFHRIGNALDESLGTRIYQAIVKLPLRTRNGEGTQALRDLDQVRTFIGSGGPAVLFDLPWLPIYLAICWAFHPIIFAVALGGAVLLATLTYLTEVLSREPTQEAMAAGAQRNLLTEASRRNAEVLQAMGMVGRMAGVWGKAHGQHLAANSRASDVAGGLGVVSKTLRMVLQSAVLGVGAYLAIQGEVTAGVIIAASILVARALAPIELAIAHWRGFLAARTSWTRLGELLTAFPQEPEPMALPAPRIGLQVEGVSVMPPGERRVVLHDVSFTLTAGQGLGVIGPSASGKSTLARAIVGVWTPARGKVRLDGAALEQWSPEQLGRHVGYLPQGVELFDGTVAQNIARFEPDADSKAIIAAAQAAGVHDMILRLPEGYETRIGESGAALSAGQRQRVGLARALYREPFLVVLDEPNSNLDAAGEAALNQAILGVRERGGIVICVAHRPSALSALDMVVMISEGRAQAFGSKDEVLRKVTRPVQAMPNVVKMVADATGAGQ